jgi:DNA-nicking Smr family endonuclease
MKKGREGDGEDQDLWNYVTRGIKAYDSSKKHAAAAKSSARKLKTLRDSPRPYIPEAALPTGKGFDRSTETRLRRGELPLEGRLDLHGMTQAQAYPALHKFIRAAVAQEKRTVLLITGKGQKFQGVLRTMVPQWLEDPELARYIIAITPASPKDGGTGAFYLRLRRPRH